MPDEVLVQADAVEIGARQRAEGRQHRPGPDGLVDACELLDDEPEAEERSSSEQQKHQRRGQALAHASFTAVVRSLPSASKAFATMPFASRPAFAYIAFGES